MIQINVFCVVVFSVFNVMNGIDVGVNFDLMFIQCDCWQIFQFCEFCFFGCNLFLDGVQLFNNIVGWVDVNLVVYGIQNQIVVVFYLSGDVIGIYDCWQFQRMCYDGGMRCVFVCVGDEVQYFLQVQLCSF